ncbi:MAG: glucokinase [Reyranellales bacterium]
MKRALLADIGGTFARFALLSGDVLGPIRTLEVRHHPTVASAIRQMLERDGQALPVECAIFALAGPIKDGCCALTNSSWTVDAAELKDDFGFQEVRLVNDHEVTAWGLPHLSSPDTRLVGPDTPVVGAPMAVLGPGTGLGMACFIPDAGAAHVLASEGGHATLAATNTREEALIGSLRRRFGHVSAERVLSGDGMGNLYSAIAEIDHIRVTPRTAAEITRAAVDGTCPASREALDVFCALLGAVAGNVALTFGARGGMFIGGGIVPRIVDYLIRTAFRERFEAKGRFRPYLAAIPVKVILRPNPAFLGLMALARNGDNAPLGRREPRQAHA